MSWNFTTSQAAINKAGIYCNTTVVASAAYLAKLSDEVEGLINSKTRRDWIANPPTADFTGALSVLASCLIGNLIVSADMSGYASRAEAQTILNVNRDFAMLILTDLKDDKIKEAMS